MIKVATAICVIAFNCSAAFAGSQQLQAAPKMQAGTQLATNMHSDPMKANAHMKKKKMKKSMMKGDMDGNMNDGMGGGMKSNGMK